MNNSTKIEEWRKLINIFVNDVCTPANYGITNLGIDYEITNHIGFGTTLIKDSKIGFGGSGFLLDIDFSYRLNIQDDVLDYDKFQFENFYIHILEIENCIFEMKIWQGQRETIYHELEPILYTTNKELAIQIFEGDFEVKDFNLNFEDDEDLLEYFREYDGQLRYWADREGNINFGLYNEILLDHGWGR